VKEGTFGRGAHRGNPSARTQLFAADRRTSHGSISGKRKKHHITVRDLVRYLTSSQRFSEIPGAFLGDGLWAHLQPGSTKDNFAPTETGTGPAYTK